MEPQWPHCGNCAAWLSKVNRCTRVLGYSVLAALAVMALLICLQSMNTGIPASRLLIVGLTATLSLLGGGIVAYPGLYVLGPGRPAAIRIPGVYIKALDWPGAADRIPREGPVVVVLAFANPEYARRFEELNGPQAPRC